MWSLWCAGVGAGERWTDPETKAERTSWSVNDGAFASHMGSHPAFELDDETTVRSAMETIKRELNREASELTPYGGTVLDWIEEMRSPEDVAED